MGAARSPSLGVTVLRCGSLLLSLTERCCGHELSLCCLLTDVTLSRSHGLRGLAAAAGTLLTAAWPQPRPAPSPRPPARTGGGSHGSAAPRMRTTPRTFSWRWVRLGGGWGGRGADPGLIEPSWRLLAIGTADTVTMATAPGQHHHLTGDGGTSDL